MIDQLKAKFKEQKHISDILLPIIDNPNEFLDWHKNPNHPLHKREVEGFYYLCKMIREYRIEISTLHVAINVAMKEIENCPINLGEEGVVARYYILEIFRKHGLMKEK